MSMRDTVHQSISRSNRNTAILSILALLIGVGGFIGAGGKSLTIPDSDITFTPTSRFILRQFGETQIMSEEELLALTPDQLPVHNVQVTADIVYNLDGDSYEYTEENGRQVSIDAYYGILEFRDADLLLRTHTIADEKQDTYKGSVVVPTTKVGKEMYEDFASFYEEDDRLTLLPFVFDAAYDTTPWYMGAGAEAVLLLGGLFGLATVAARSNPDNHPIIKRMARFGEADGVMSQIDGEMMSGQVAQVDKLQLTRNWVVYKSGNDMNFARISDIMWAYKHVTQTRYGKNYAAYIWDRSGQMLNIAGNEKNVDAMIIAVLQRAPWAIAGYNKDIEKSWQNDRAGFVRTVDDRLKQMTTPQ